MRRGFGRRGGRSLLGTAAHAAVAGAAVQATAGRVAARQQAAAAPQWQAAAPVPPPAAEQPGVDDLVEGLTKLGKLRDAGLLTDEEFAAQKARLLG